MKCKKQFLPILQIYSNYILTYSITIAIDNHLIAIYDEDNNFILKLKIAAWLPSSQFSNEECDETNL